MMIEEYAYHWTVVLLEPMGYNFVRNVSIAAGDMAYYLKVLATLPEDSVLIQWLFIEGRKII